MGNPVRVVSLLPSATEIITEVIRAGEPCSHVLSCSHECDYGPVSLAQLPVLTSARTKFTSSKDVDDQSLCQVCSVDYRLIEALARRMPEPHPAIVDLSPQNLWEVLDDLRRVGEAVGQPGAGQRAIDGLRGRIEAVAALARERLAAGAARPRCLVAEWTDPIFVGGHWTPQIVHMAGGEHVLNPGREDGGAGKSYTVPFDRLLEADPEWLIIAPCGLDLAVTRQEMGPLVEQPAWSSLRAVKEQKVVLVDGNQMFNRSGPRLVDALEFLFALFWDRPDLMPKAFPYEYL
ncbi:hypothetical protein QBZ16_002601 [Prototheca wickerhamii]|uniref:Fe/B12 periplasmic-binding domain-containing protein n=1 Tax=Prototheca wickerhamii TaxID=3111 RepID=A0AAD9IJM1_PROWI|nr:hypothetical protein QBZ16_002601 [Prototheca wickerhamii]